MKFKIIITILLKILISNFSFANFYQKGDTLNVWAVSGLNMREGPGTDFHKIQKLEYGDQIVVTDNYLQSSPLSLTVVKKNKKSDAFVLKGFWVRVKIGEQEGYIFDGYLSRFPTLAITKNEECEGHWFSEDFLDYAKREFNLLKEEKKELSDIGEYSYESTFENDIKFTRVAFKCADSNFKINDISINETYLFLNVKYQMEHLINGNKKEKDKHNLDGFFVVNKRGEFEINISNSECYNGVKFKDGNANFYSSCCC